MNHQQNPHYEFLRREIDQIPAISAHDHLQRESEAIASPTDLFHLLLSGMPFVDMITAGLKTEPGDGVMGNLGPFGERNYEAIWKRRGPWLEHIRDTTEFRHYLRGIQELFDFHEDLNESNWREINDRIIAAQKAGWYGEVLKKRGNVKGILLERPWTWAQTEPADRFYTLNVYPVTEWVALDYSFRKSRAEQGTPIESLDAAVEAFDRQLEQAMREGIIALKLHQAYIRILEFEPVNHSEAEKQYPCPDHEGWTHRAAQDYMADHIARRAGELGIPLCFHTGYQLGHYNEIRNANAQHLTSLIRRHPKTHFDLFHLSYPYCEEALMLAKYFPNVTVNFTFADLLSTSKVVQMLHVALELLPSNKVFAWGADSGAVEATYGSLCTTRDCVARCMAEKVDAGYLTRERAIRLMHKLMHENAGRAYKVDEWKASHPA